MLKFLAILMDVIRSCMHRISKGVRMSLADNWHRRHHCPPRPTPIVPTHEEIAIRAYTIYREEYPEGFDTGIEIEKEIWLTAEETLIEYDNPKEN
jgi:4-diphosphocytidyl-2C-methyl-D-erythritol kinase